MKKVFTSTLFLAALLLTVATSSVQAQKKPAAQPRYKDLVEANSNADADIKIVREYLTVAVEGNIDKAKMLLASNYKGYGPSVVDSATTEQVVRKWKQNYEVQSNRKTDFLCETFRVKAGPLKGDWVAVWGTYSYTQNGKNIVLPIHYTGHVVNGKIDRDHIYYDNLYVARVLGYTLTPPAAAAK